MSEDTYSSPLVTRYASKEMVKTFSAKSRVGTWRRLWCALARSEHELGLPIQSEQIAELEAAVDNIDFDLAAKYEKDLRHDVMAHVKTFGDAAPSAAGIIHLGATSCFITDNADLILHRQACEIVLKRLISVCEALKPFILEYAALPCLGWTHFQPAQLTTVGKRACLWAQDLALDAVDLRRYIDELPMRGVKGTTGTQASFLELFSGDESKVMALDAKVAAAFSFRGTIAVSGQTYTRKLDEKLMAILSGIAGSSAKFATDMRLLMHLRELEEPFEKNQIGSSAMAYKRNPMRSERICSLARFVQAQHQVLSQTVSTQWLERTLDDSACRRLSIPEAFMGVDAILRIYHNIASGLVVYPERIAARVHQELPFMATEKIIMECVRNGGDRQEAHESIRQHSMIVRENMDRGKGGNDLVERLASDPVFSNIAAEFPGWMDPIRFTGCARSQALRFLDEVLSPLIANEIQSFGTATMEPLSV